MNVEQLYHNPLTVQQHRTAVRVTILSLIKHWIKGWGINLAVSLAIALGMTNLSYAATSCQAPKSAEGTNTSTPPDIRINGNNLESTLSTIMASADEPITINYFPRDLNVALRINLSAGRLVQVNESQWQLYPNPQQASEVDLCAGDFYSRLHILAGVAKAQLSQSYPSPHKSPSPSAYQVPATFIEVESAAAGQVQLSPHFQLWQFLPSGSTSWPQYTLVSLGLLEKLELVIAVLAEHKKQVSTLHILSGYRSPAHNARVGGAAYSRHQYGDAVDFIVDANNDGKMDDLNEDGSINRLDLDWLTDRLARRSVPVSAGGTGTYESTGQAAAFIHLDARGRDHYWQ